MLKEGAKILLNGPGKRPSSRGAKRPLWVASLYPPKKYINILVENLYYTIGIIYIDKLRVLPQCPTPLSFLILGYKVLHTTF